jgi:hypothetical protein
MEPQGLRAKAGRSPRRVDIWRQTVSRMASVSSVALIDVSKPTGNLI